MEVKECIARYRKLDAECRERQAELEKAREEFNRLDAEHATRVAEWDAERSTMTGALNAAIEQEAAVAQEAEQMEEAAEQLLAKVAQRQKKNGEHHQTLLRHREELERQSTHLEARDANIKAELAAFREARDATREQLLATIREMEGVIPRTRAEHDARANELRAKITEVEERIVAEARAWALEMARRERDAKRKTAMLLNEEAQFASEGRALWNDLLRAAVPASCAAETAKEIAYLRHKMSRTAA